MKTKLTSSFYLIILSLFALSCGNKSTVAPSMFESSSSNNLERRLDSDDTTINERVCIDQRLTKDLDAGESIRKLVANSDFDFCNGVRLRLKTYQFASKKFRVYGFVRSNSGKETCLRESDDFIHSTLRGEKGTLVGENIKILLGGHRFNSDNSIEPSEHKLARYVKFEWSEYKGELAIHEKGKLRCWAIQ